jgi:cardiolipin synthase
MQLHRTTGKPDWVVIKPEARNAWQRFAAATKSVVTPGNAVSLVGLLIVCEGMYMLFDHRPTTGLWLIVGGRFCDVADGFVADHTGTKSPLGEAVDATFDKIGALGILVAVGIEHIVPWWAVGIIGAQNAANSVIAYVGWRRKLAIQPVLSGKLSTALQWLSLSCFLVAAAYGHVWQWPAYVALVPALVLGFVATSAYGKLLAVSTALKR